MTIVMWVSKTQLEGYKEFCRVVSPCVALQVLNFFTRSEEYFEAKFRFSFDKQTRRYKFITLLKKLGYKGASQAIPGTLSFYSEIKCNRINVPTGITRNIM